MVLAQARCSNWPSLPHGQLRPVLSPETITSQTCRAQTHYLEHFQSNYGSVTQDLLKCVASKDSVTLSLQTKTSYARQSWFMEPAWLSQVVCQLGEIMNQDDKQADTRLKTHLYIEERTHTVEENKLACLLFFPKPRQSRTSGPLPSPIFSCNCHWWIEGKNIHQYSRLCCYLN